MKDGKTIVLLQGAFDIINYGHIRAFKRAKALGDQLIIALNTNELLMEYKGREAVLPWYQKKFIIESCKYVDKVIPAPEFSPLKILKKHKVDIYVITDEWKETKSEEIAYMKSIGGKVSISPRFKGVIQTSKIKEILLQEYLQGYRK